MYVFHELGNQIADPHVAHLLAGSDAAIRIPLKLLYIPTMAALTYGAAWTSYRFFEGPLNELKRHFPYFLISARQIPVQK
jgi:peptidoglycan/LPS O-acetylase OafA/YrhL